MFCHILAFSEIHYVHFIVLNDSGSSFNKILKNETLSWYTESQVNK